MRTRVFEPVYPMLAALVILTGCQRHQQNDQKEKHIDVLARGPNAVTPSAVPDYANKTINATGGLDAWTGTKEMQLDCVVTFFRPDGSVYLTEQSYRVYPWSNALEIADREPQGKFIWRFRKGRLDVVQGRGQIGKLAVAVMNRCFAGAVLNIVTAPVRFLDRSTVFARQGAAVQMHGQWYNAFARKVRAGVKNSAAADEAIFYQDRDNFLVDMIGFACEGKYKSVTVRGYDYRKAEKGEPAVPMRIEIFRGGGETDSAQRLIKIDCYKLRRVK
jgi:hypothetical protein